MVMSHSDSDDYPTWAFALKLTSQNFYALPYFNPKPAIATMSVARKDEDGAYDIGTYKGITYEAAVASLPSPPPSSSDSSDSSSPTSSEEGAEFLFGWAESRKERRRANRELKKNTRMNNGMYRVKERLAIFKEEEECGFCFGWDSDDEECESEDEMDKAGEEAFDGGGEKDESEDSDSLCNDDDDEDGSSVAQDEEMGDNGEINAGNERDEEEDSDEEMMEAEEEGKESKRKPRKSVSWKDDDELAEIHIVKREDLSMNYVFGQERAIMMKEDGTTKFASKKATDEQAAADEPITKKKTTRVGSQRIDPSQEGEPYVFGQQQATATKAELRRSDSPQEEPVASDQQHRISTEAEARNITIVQTTKEEEAFVFGRQSGIWEKNEPEHIARTTITSTEVQPETVDSEPEEAFVFGKQPGIWSKSGDDIDSD